MWEDVGLFIYLLSLEYCSVHVRVPIPVLDIYMDTAFGFCNTPNKGPSNGTGTGEAEGEGEGEEHKQKCCQRKMWFLTRVCVTHILACRIST